jgi:hypothetical protein
VSEVTAPGDEARAVIEAEPAQPVGEKGPDQAAEKLSRTDRARGSAYRSRFALVYVALALLAGIGIGAFVVLVTRPDPAPPPRWSSWEPTGSSTAQVRQIADRVARQYRQTNGQQLVAALPSEPKVTGSEGDVPVSTIAVRPDTSKGQKEESQIDVIPAENSYQYVLCGLGTNCSIKGGTASTERHALLRREALELALYTFKYVDGVETVSVFLPPRPDGQASPTAVFLKRGDVRKELGKPLPQTIGAKAPAIGKMTREQLAVVNRITEPRLYTYEYQQAQDGSAVLIYDPVVLGT